MRAIDKYIRRRSDLLANHHVPRQSETNGNLPSNLGEVVLKTMTLTEQKLMGITDKLKGPQESININEIVDKSLSRQLILKSLSHEHVLEIGDEILKKSANETQTLIDQAVTETSAYEKYEASKRIEFAIMETRKTEKDLCELKVKDMIRLFNEEAKKYREAMKLPILIKDLVNMITRLTWEIETQQKSIKFERKIIDEHKALIDEKLKYLRTEFQKRITEAVLSRKLHDMKILQKFWNDFKNELEKERIDLLTQHIAEIMHVVCAERTRAAELLAALDKELTEKIEKLENENYQLKNTDPPKLIECPVNKIWKTKCFKILLEFEKFSEFIMETMPTQGKFLVNFEKMINDSLSDELHADNYFNCTIADVKQLRYSNNIETKYFDVIKTYNTLKDKYQDNNLTTIDDVKKLDHSNNIEIKHSDEIKTYNKLKTDYQDNNSSITESKFDNDTDPLIMNTVEFKGKSKQPEPEEKITFSQDDYTNTVQKLIPDENVQWQKEPDKTPDTGVLSHPKEDVESIMLRFSMTKEEVENSKFNFVQNKNYERNECEKVIRCINTKEISEKIVKLLSKFSPNIDDFNKITLVSQILQKEMLPVFYTSLFSVTNLDSDSSSQLKTSKLLLHTDSLEILMAKKTCKIPAKTTSPTSKELLPTASFKLLGVRDSLATRHSKHVLHQKKNELNYEELENEKLHLKDKAVQKQRIESLKQIALSHAEYLTTFKNIPPYLKPTPIISNGKSMNYSKLDWNKIVDEIENDDSLVSDNETDEKSSKHLVNLQPVDSFKKVRVRLDEPIQSCPFTCSFVATKPILHNKQPKIKKISTTEYNNMASRNMDIRMKSFLKLMTKDTPPSNFADILNQE